MCRQEGGLVSVCGCKCVSLAARSDLASNADSKNQPPVAHSDIVLFLYFRNNKVKSKLSCSGNVTKSKLCLTSSFFRCLSLSFKTCSWHTLCKRIAQNYHTCTTTLINSIPSCSASLFVQLCLSFLHAILLLPVSVIPRSSSLQHIHPTPSLHPTVTLPFHAIFTTAASNNDHSKWHSPALGFRREPQPPPPSTWESLPGEIP